MLELAEVAYKLSLKHDLKNEAKRIEKEEFRLARLLQEEKEHMYNLTSRFEFEEQKLASLLQEMNPKQEPHLQPKQQIRTKGS